MVNQLQSKQHEQSVMTSQKVSLTVNCLKPGGQFFQLLYKSLKIFFKIPREILVRLH